MAFHSFGLGSDAKIEHHVPKHHHRSNISGLKIEKGTSALDATGVRSQLRGAMERMATTRVIDVLRAWDTDENGSISRREFAGGTLRPAPPAPLLGLLGTHLSLLTNFPLFSSLSLSLLSCAARC